MVLESLVSSILVKYLGDYVVGLQAENLKLGIFSGDVSLANLELNPNALDELQIPVKIKSGFLGKLTMKIPWKSLGSQPTVINVEKVYMLISPVPDTERTAAVEKRKAMVTKRKQLQLAELIGAGGGDSDKEVPTEEKESGFAKKLVERVVHNIQLYVNEIHIRYEDPKAQCAFGITLQLLHAYTVDESGKPIFLNAPGKLVHKNVVLKNLAVYWDNDEAPLKYSTTAELGVLLDALIYKDDDRKGGGRHRYIVEPISGQLHVIMNTSDVPDLLNPKMVFEMAIDQIWLSLNEAQFRSIQDLAENYIRYFKVRRNLQHRPDLRPTQPGAAKLWWAYIRDTIVADIKKKRYRWSWTYLKSRKEARVEYVRLWRLHKLKKTKPEEEQRIEALEEKWDLEDILLFRSLAEVLVKREKKAQDEAKAKAGWFGGWFGGGAAAATAGAPAETLSTEDWQRLYTAIDFQESKPLPSSIPPELVKMRFVFKLAATGVKLINYIDNHELVAGALHGIQASVDLRPAGSMSCTFSLNQMRVMDAYSVAGKPLAILHSAKETEQQLAGSLDIKPLNRKEDIVVQVKAQALHALFARPLVDRLAKFFSHRSEALEQLQLAAYDSIDQLQQAAATSIKYALDKKKVVAISLDLAAPVLHIPQSPTDDRAPTLVVSLGLLELRSDHSAREEADRQQKALLSQDPNVTISSDYFYDRFSVKLTGISSYIRTSHHHSADGSKQPKGFVSLIDPFEFQLDLRVCTAPSPLLPKIVVNAKLPELSLHLNAWSIKTLLAIAETAAKNTQPADEKGLTREIASSSSTAVTSAQQSKPTQPRGLLRPEDEEARLVKADLMVSKISVTLAKSGAHASSDVKPDPLIDFTVSSVGVQFEKARVRMEAVVTVGSCEISDRTSLYSSHPQYSCLMKSHALTELQKKVQEQPSFIWLRFEQVDRISRKYAGIDNQVELLLGRLTFNFNRETVIAVAETMFALQAMMDKSSAVAASQVAAANARARLAKEANAVFTQSEEEVFTLGKVRIAMTRAEVVLHRNHGTEPLAVAGVERMALGVEVFTNKTLQLAGEVGAVIVSDLTTSGSTHSNWRECVRLPYVPPHPALQHSQTISGAISSPTTPPRSPAPLHRSASQVQIAKPSLLKTSFTADANITAPATAATPEPVGVEWSFRTYKSREESEYGVDMAARADVGQCRVLVVWRFLTTILNTMQDFNKMLSAVMPKPNTTTTSTSSMNPSAAQQPASPAKLIKYEVSVSNPTTVIVGDEREATASYLALDFGRLFASNNFAAAPGPTGSFPEHIDVVIQDLAWRTRVLNGSGETMLLDRFSTALLVDRDEDQLERHLRVKLELTELAMQLSDTHIQVLNDIVTKNICSVPWPFPSAPPTPPAVTSPHHRDAPPSLPAGGTPMVISATGQIARIGFVLRQADAPLLESHLEKTAFDFSQGAGSMEFALRVANLVVRDCRVRTTNRFPMMLGPSERCKQRQLALEFKQSPGLRNVLLTLDATRITAAPSFLGIVSDFSLNTLLPKINDTTAKLLSHMAAAPAPAAIEQAPQPLAIGRGRSTVTLPKLPLESTPGAISKGVAESVTMVAKVQLQAVEAMMVGDETDPSTQALVAALATMLEATLSENEKKMQMNVTEIRLFKCRANLVERTSATILNPMSITLLFDQKAAHLSDPASTRIDAKLSPIEMFASYHDLRLLMRLSDQYLKVLQQMKPKTAPALPEKARERAAAPVTPPASSLTAASTSATPSSMGIQFEESSGAVGAAGLAGSASGFLKPIEDMTLSFPRFELTLINDCLTTDATVTSASTSTPGVTTVSYKSQTFSMPLLYVFAPAFGAHIRSWSSSLSAEFRTEVRADYFNSRRDEWEPLMEPIGYNIKMSSAPPPAHSPEKPSTAVIEMAAVSFLNLNITQVFVESLLLYFETWQRDMAAAPAKSTTPGSSDAITASDSALASSSPSNDHLLQEWHPFVITNQTGNRILYSVVAVSRRTEDKATPAFMKQTSSYNIAGDIAAIRQMPLPPASASQQTTEQVEEDLYASRFRKRETEGAVSEIVQEARELESNESHALDVLELDRDAQRTRLRAGPPHTHALCVLLHPSLPALNRLPLTTVGTYFIPLPNKQPLVYEVSSRAGAKVATLRSNVQIRNNSVIRLGLAVELRNLTTMVGTGAALSSNLHELGVVEPESTLGLPLQWAQAGLLRFRPADIPSYEWSTESVNLVSLNSASGFVSCKSSAAPAWIYSCHVSRTPIDAEHDNWLVTLSAPVVIENLLPERLQFRVHDHRGEISTSGRLEKGQTQMVYQLDMRHEVNISVKLPLMDEGQWSDKTLISAPGANTKDLAPEVLVRDANKGTLHVRIDHQLHPNGSRTISLHTACWMLNKTGLRVLYKKTPDGHVLYGQSKASTPHEDERWKAVGKVGSQPQQWFDFQSEELLRPYMFSYEQASIRVANSQFSDVFPLKAQRSSGAISILDMLPPRSPPGTPQTVYEVAVYVRPAPGKFWRTKLVTLSARYVLVNRTPLPLFYRQDPTTPEQHADQSVRKASSAGLLTSPEYALAPGSRIPLLWSNHQLSRLLSVREDDSMWSRGFPLSSVGGFDVRLRKRGSSASNLLRVTIHLEKATTLITFTYNAELPQYRISNKCRDWTVVVSQEGEQEKIRVLPQDDAGFAWENLMAEKKRIVLQVVNTSTNQVVHEDTYALDKFRPREQKQIAADKILGVAVRPVGPTKCIEVTQATQLQNVLLTGAGTGGEDKTKSQAHQTFRFQFSLPGVGISFIDNRPQEIFFLSLSQLYLEYGMSAKEQSVEFSIERIQIDNSLYNTPYPILMYPLPAKGRKCLEFTVVHAKEYETFMYIRYMALQMQEIDIRMDEVLLLNTLNFTQTIMAFMNRRQAMNEEERWMRSFNAGAAFSETGAELDTSGPAKMYYFELLTLNPIKLRISFMTVPALTARYDNIAAASSLERDAQVVMLEHLLAKTGILANIEGAELSINALILKHPFVSLPELTSRVTQHYMAQVMAQLYKILGAADVLGAPVSLVSNLGTGVYDFFYEPGQALVSSPKDFGDAIAKGSSSLLKKSVFGIFNTATKITTNITKVAELATFDDSYKQEREVSRVTNRPKHAGEGVVEGLKGFGMGFVKAATGIVEKPKEGLKKEGGLGLLKGIGQGVAGVVVKPVIGTVDLVAKTTEGIRNTTTYFDEKERRRVRLPRHFCIGQGLHPYSSHRAAGQYLLKTINDAAYQREPYALSVRIVQPHQTLWIVVSPGHIMGISSRKEATDPELDRVDQTEVKLLWVFPYAWLRSVTWDAQLCQIKLLFVSPTNEKNERILPCESPQQMNDSYRKLQDFQESLKITLQTIALRPIEIPVPWDHPLSNSDYQALQLKRETEQQARQEQLLAQKEAEQRRVEELIRKEWDEQQRLKREREEQRQKLFVEQQRRWREREEKIKNARQQLVMRRMGERERLAAAKAAQKKRLKDKADGINVPTLAESIGEDLDEEAELKESLAQSPPTSPAKTDSTVSSPTTSDPIAVAQVPPQTPEKPSQKEDTAPSPAPSTAVPEIVNLPQPPASIEKPPVEQTTTTSSTLSLTNASDPVESSAPSPSASQLVQRKKSDLATAEKKTTTADENTPLMPNNQERTDSNMCPCDCIIL